MTAWSSWRREKPKVEPPIVAGRVPPHDLDAEAAILSCAMLEGSAVAWAAGALLPEHFYSEANGRIWEACCARAKSGEPVDAVTVATWLRDRDKLAAVGGPAYLAQIVDATPHVSRRHFEAYLEIVKLAWLKRRRIAIYQRAAAELYGDVGDAAEHFAATDLELMQLRRSHGGKRSRPERATDIMQRRWKEIMAEAEGKPGRRKVFSGMVDVDRHTGGWQGGDFVVLAARPGMGKSSWAFDVAANVALAGHGVAVFSVEMVKHQVTDRMLCQRAGVNGKRLFQGRLLDEDWSKLAKAAAIFSGQGKPLPLWIQDASGITLEEIRAQCVDIASECERDGAPLGLVVIDHVGIMKPHDAKASREQQIAVISGGCKAMAKELDTVVLGLSQLSRAVESRPIKDRRPQLSDLRDSGALEQDADQVVMLFREHYYDESANPNVAEALWRKFRGGELATVTQGWDGPTTRFSDLGGEAGLVGQW